MKNATQTKIIEVFETLKAIDPKNHTHIMADRKVKEMSSDVISYFEQGEESISNMIFEDLKEYVAKFDEINLVPSNVEIGMGATQVLYSDRNAFTIIKKTEKSITVQRDNAKLTSTPEFVTGGFAGHCTNNNSQTYDYEKNPNGETITYRWSEKKQRYQNKYSSLIKGRHEKYDYNF